MTLYYFIPAEGVLIGEVGLLYYLEGEGSSPVPRGSCPWRTLFRHGQDAHATARLGYLALFWWPCQPWLVKQFKVERESIRHSEL
jgi:hypothetical protein